MMTNLTRFLTAQSGTYLIALAELRQGWKVTHWMWFIFPQLRGFGRSATVAVFLVPMVFPPCCRWGRDSMKRGSGAKGGWCAWCMRSCTQRLLDADRRYGCGQEYAACGFSLPLPTTLRCAGLKGFSASDHFANFVGKSRFVSIILIDRIVVAIMLIGFRGVFCPCCGANA